MICIAVLKTKIIITELYKKILKKKKILTKGMDANKKDAILSKAGRIIALVIYSLIYLVNEFCLNKSISLDGTLLTGLLSGSLTTLTISKGMYTSIRQHFKKKSIFEELEEARKQVATLSTEMVSVAETQNEDVFIVSGK